MNGARRLGVRFALTALAASGLVSVASPARAGVFVVDTGGDARDAVIGDGQCATEDGDCTLRAAIQEANSTSLHDSIRLPVGTLEMLILPTDEDVAQNGDFDVTNDLTIVGKGARKTEIVANGLERVFDVLGDGTELTAKDLTIGDGHVGQAGEGEGGGVRLGAGTTVSLFRVAVVDNLVFTPGGRGGGIFNDGGTVLLTDTLVARNVSRGPGGGIFSDGPLALRNVTISGNTSHSAGGGVAIPSEATAVNVTVTRNTADYDDFAGEEGGGVAVLGGTFTLSNSVLAANTVGSGGGPDCSGPVSSEGYNVVGNGDGCDLTPGTGDQVGTSAAPIDPALGVLANNGGPTATHALLPGSPALDSGNPATLGSAGGCRELDQRGVPRDLGGVCDGGGYERVLCRERVVNRVGTSGADHLNGTAGPDGLLALGGGGLLKGRGAGDGLCGGPGRDELEGEAGPDRLDGGPGNDLCDGGSGRDAAIGCERRLGFP